MNGYIIFFAGFIIGIFFLSFVLSVISFTYKNMVIKHRGGRIDFPNT